MDPELESIALQAKADEAHDARAAAERVREFEGTAAQSARTPEEEKAIEEKAQLQQIEAMIKGQLPKVCAIAWGAVDALAIKYAGLQYAQTPEERAQLAEMTAPVVLKYLPKDMSWLATTPEGALIMTAAVIYALKFAATPPEATKSDAPVAPLPSPVPAAPATPGANA